MNPIVLYNTLTRQKEEFVPIDSTNVRMYVCGVTPYDHSHIGHAFSAVAFDVLFRLLRHVYGETHVRYARNFTDVDDKIINRANETGQKPEDVANIHIKSYHEDMDALNVLMPTVEPKITTHMQEILAFIDDLLKEKVAYVTASGDVNYDISKAPSREGYTYGKLSGKKLEDLIAGARVDVDADKKNPGDFALWKAAKPGEPSWDAGPTAQEHGAKAGRPGWHIECSAMSLKELGERFDIHGGGEDLQFPHHENEIAQSESQCGHQHVNYWMHNAFVTVEGRKMSKSLGNFTLIKDVLENFSGEAVRLWLMQTSYRKPVDYSEEALRGAQKRVNRLHNAMQNGPVGGTVQQEEIDKIANFLADDLNTARALSVLDVLRPKALEDADAAATLRAAAGLLGVV